MKTMNPETIKFLGCLAIAAAVVSGCSIKKSVDALSDAQIKYNATDPNLEIPGMGSTSTTTTDGVVGRILVGLENRVNPTTNNSNFRSVLLQVATNLPQVPDPLKAVGWDQTPLLAYAACSDLQPATIQSAYGVNANNGVTAASMNAAQRTALVNAGLRMTDQFVGGLASTGPYSAQATAIFRKLVDDNVAIPAETARQAFISVCMTATVFGVHLRGF